MLMKSRPLILETQRAPTFSQIASKTSTPSWTFLSVLSISVWSFLLSPCIAE